MESEEDSKESGVSLKTDRSKCYKIWSSVRIRMKNTLCCASAERDDSQGCTAHVKDTPPSPEEKPEDLIGADIDSVRDDEDWAKSSYSLMAKGSMESIDSGVSFKSDWSKKRLIDFRHHSPPSWSDLSSYLMDNAVAHHKDLFKSSCSLMAKGSRESIDSGVSFKSDWSQGRLINFKARVSLSRSDLSSYLIDNPVTHHKDLFKSSCSLMPLRRAQSEPVKSNFLIPLSQQSPLMMAMKSVEAFGSSLSPMNDSVIRNQQRSLHRMVLRNMDAFGSSLSMISDSFIRTGQPRDELNQELSSEVGWEHC